MQPRFLSAAPRLLLPTYNTHSIGFAQGIFTSVQNNAGSNSIFGYLSGRGFASFDRAFGGTQQQPFVEQVNFLLCKLAEDRDKQKTTAKNLAEELETVLGEREETGKQLAAANDKLQDVTAENTVLTAECAQLMLQKDVLSAEKNAAVNQQEVLTAEKNSLQKQVRTLAADLNRLLQKWDAHADERRDALQQKDQLAAEVQQLEEKCVQMSLQRDAAAAEKYEAVRVRDAAVERINLLASENTTLAAGLAQAVHARDIAVSERDGILSHSERDRVSAAGLVEKLTAEVEQLKDAVAQLQQQLDEWSELFSEEEKEKRKKAASPVSAQEAAATECFDMELIPPYTAVVEDGKLAAAGGFKDDVSNEGDNRWVVGRGEFSAKMKINAVSWHLQVVDTGGQSQTATKRETAIWVGVQHLDPPESQDSDEPETDLPFFGFCTSLTETQKQYSYSHFQEISHDHLLEGMQQLHARGHAETFGLKGTDLLLTLNFKHGKVTLQYRLPGENAHTHNTEWHDFGACVSDVPVGRENHFRLLVDLCRPGVAVRMLKCEVVEAK
eukprot:GDKI01031263.1.p1 GENE.GDKI01031263.1~~GDKI01031263.1.p1  ORF type:complete len:554 (-),score=209.39 GDKI01031263.1:407-2068(-)